MARTVQKSGHRAVQSNLLRIEPDITSLLWKRWLGLEPLFEFWLIAVAKSLGFSRT